jgi:hypothetical protein
MPQETNLNVSPYFDDFDPSKNYHKVLFKPGYPVQARELTTIQSILQDQIEKFGNHVFKEGDSVTGGGIHYTNTFNSVLIERSFSGISVSSYLSDLLNKVVIGSVSGVRAKVKAYLNRSAFPGEPYTLYVNYLETSNDNETFLDGESLLIEDGLSNDTITIQPGEGIASILPENALSIGSAATLSTGVYYIRGYFIELPEQTIILEPYNNFPTYRIGLEVFEEIINSDIDESLNDNAKGFSNYTAPGSDRLKIRAFLTKKPADNIKYENFIELMVVRDGEITSIRKDTEYNELSKEFARRTYDESGDYYIIPAGIQVKETLNDLKGNKGVFFENQTTYNNNVPNDDLGTYVISPTKAYVQGYEVETISPTYLDFPKPRTTKNLQDQSVNYLTGPTYSLNRVSGSPIIGISTSYIVSLRSDRIGVTTTSAAGKEIGVARVYDFALESGSYDSTNPNTNVWDASFYDIQTYTEITLNRPITLSTPTHIKGKSSGAVGFLRYSTSNSGIITAYNTKGFFAVGESFIFDGIENNRVSTAVTSYSTSDVKSIYGIVGAASTFNADVIQSTLNEIGLVNISAASGGVSTVTSADLSKYFVGVATVGNIVAYSNPGLSIPTFSKVVSVSQNSIVISGVTTVSGVCDGGLPSTTINPSDFRVLTSNFQSSIDNTLYTVLPKRNVASVDLTTSNLPIRKQFDVNITSGSTGAITSGSSNETFLPFDEERYVLIRSDGTTEPLSADKFVFTNGGTTLTINGLGSNSSAKLIATLRKTNVKSKVKNKNRVKTITVSKSKYSQSGIGVSTLNDGLTFGSGYGTRVQDEEICLLVPDVFKIHGIFESSGTSDATLPTLTLTSLSGPTNKTGDLLVGEEFVGQDNKFVGLYVGKVDDLRINFTSLNSNNLTIGEVITFKESGITAIVTDNNVGDNNITSNFTFDNGQRDTIYDYSRIIRKPSSKEPTRRLKIVFEYADFSSSDTGDITTVNSYDQFDYCDLPSINSIRTSDIIDIRPRVSEFTSSTLSPFEFQARDFTSQGNSASNVLASDESILLDYSFYLPRIDKIFLSKDGVFQLVNGVPEETPLSPNVIENTLEVATLTLPAYLCDINEVSVNLNQHKRYRMSDISNLENRIKNLEFYTSLSLLESDTSNLYIRDADGLNRFKSGFFVDDFSSTTSQIKKTIVKNSIDVKNSELRPSHYTTEIDLVLGSNALIGIGTAASPQIDQRFVTDLDGIGIRRTGRVLTLQYAEVEHISQPFATRVENVTPYLVNYYYGTIELNPSSDVWVDTTRLSAKNIEIDGNYNETVSQLVASGFDPQTGYGPVTWGSWETTWTGETKTNSSNEAWQGSNLIRTDYQTTTKTGTKSRTGTRQVFKEAFDDISLGDSVLSTQLVPFVRSRNIEFTSKRLKPITRVYGFFDGIDINQYIIPKLIEVTMVSGSFQVGETVRGEVQNGPSITFRVAQQNHKYGPYNNPTDVYTNNPYNRDQTIPSSYSSTSTLINVDTFSLSEKSQNQFFGYIQTGMKLKGQTSGAQATISNIRLVTDSVGTIIGCIYIPDPNIDINPRFESGTKLFRLTNSNTNTQIPGFVSTSAEERFESKGSLNKVQENILSVRSIRFESKSQQESSSTSATDTVVVGTTLLGTIQPPRPTPVTPPTQSTPDVVSVTPGQNIFVPVTQSTQSTVAPTSSGVDPFVLKSVQSAYVDYLGRRPETSGEQYWSTVRYNELRAQGKTALDAVSQIQIEIANSPEATVLGKGVIASQQSQYQVVQSSPTPGVTLTSQAVQGTPGPTPQAEANSALIVAAYRQSLGRTPAQSEINDWLGVVSNSGGNIGQAILDIKNSTEAQRFKCGLGLDPLAQSFYIESDSGIFVTSIDLFFRSKDETLPVIVQLRPMQLGLPTEQIYPFSEVVIDAKDVNISEDGSIATRVTFESPVYLTGQQYHSLVVLSSSNEYTVWISRLGEVDISTANQVESRQVVVTSQPILGSLFKSQNGSTWNASQYEDIKFTLNRAVFASGGNVNFYNPILDIDSDQTPFLLKDALELSSKKIRVGLGSTVQDSGLTLGNTVTQFGSNASGIYVGSAGTATGSLTITNSGIGYTPSSGSTVYSNVSLTNVTGSGRNATANITISNGVAVAATISNGGTGYSVGDVLTATQIGITSLGRNLRLSVTDITGINELVLDNVQGDFLVGAGGTVRYTNNLGITTTLNASTGGNVLIPTTPTIVTDGLHIKVNQKNHGMHSTLNRVEISNVISDIAPTRLIADYTSSSTSTILVADSTNFGTFENVGVGTTNPGYARIGQEIISYTGVSTNSLIGITRSVDSTLAFNYTTGDFVYKYELGGVSLRRINKVHDLSDATVSDSIGLDHYNIKLDMSTNGVDRSVGTSLPKLYLNETKSTGGDKIKSTENIQYEVITPIVENITPSGTNISAVIRTVSGTSVDGSEISFVDKGFENITLKGANYLSSPRLIASRVNETNSLTTLPGSRSFTMTLNLSSTDSSLSPVVDLHRVAMILTSNRVNQPITNYITDNRTSSIIEDPNAFVYAINPISLESPATSIKVYLSAYLNVYNDVRAFYAIAKDSSEELIYYPFPGYSNLLQSGQVIDISNSDGSSDKFVPKSDTLALISDQAQFTDLEFTIDNLPTFRYFSVKIIGTSTNQAYPPRLRDLRTIALA